jgi:hypothetical protein
MTIDLHAEFSNFSGNTSSVFASQGFVFSVERNGTPPARCTSNRLLRRLTNSGLSLRLGEHDPIEAQQLAD